MVEHISLSVGAADLSKIPPPRHQEIDRAAMITNRHSDDCLCGCQADPLPYPELGSPSFTTLSIHRGEHLEKRLPTTGAGLARPSVGRLERDRAPPHTLGCVEFSRLLQRESVTAKDVRTVGHIFGPGGSDHLGRKAHAMRIAEHEADRMRELECRRIERVG